MKKTLLALLLSGCITLAGCASLLERDYVSVTSHTGTTTDAGSSVLRVENYQELVNSLIYFISTGSEDGVVRLYMNADSVDEHMRAARLEILQEYPPAAYAVENITFDVNPLVAYTEARIQFSYRRTPQQVASIRPVTGVSAVRSELSNALSRYADECVLSIRYFDQDEDYVRDLIQQAYYASPGTALEFPTVQVNIYPDSGRQRIVEVLFHYAYDTTRLSERAALVNRAAARLWDDLPDTHPANAAHAILSLGGYMPGQGSTAYDALLNGGADDEGLALAMALVCEKANIPCKVARGIFNGEPHFWNVVTTDDGWRHLDLSRVVLSDEGDSHIPFFTDSEWMSEGYLWVESLLPVCD